MDDIDQYCLILKSKAYYIPSNFKFLSDVNHEIYQKLMTKKQYVIKSNISDAVLKSFINHWINNKIPDIHANNISEYESLSIEFDRMKNIIQIYKNINQINDKIVELNEITNNYKKIIKFFFNCTESEFDSQIQENKNEIIEAIKGKNDTKILKIIKQKQYFENGIIFSINEDDRTAGVLKNKSEMKDIYIPHSIYYDNLEFPITTIHENAFKNSNMLKTIKFHSKSKLRTIKSHAFDGSSLQQIIIPSNVVEIGDYSFSNLHEIQKVEFSKHSKLRRIGSYAFCHSSLTDISIPPHVSSIEDSCFYCCHDLQSIELDENSDLQKICKFAFSYTSLMTITIPSHVSSLEEGWCCGTPNLMSVKISKNNKNFTSLDDCFILGKINSQCVLLFACRNVEEVTIPSYVEQIASYSFSQCKQLRKVVFEANSKIQIIEKNAFSYSSLESIVIPPHLTTICEDAFFQCSKLKKVQFSDDSKLIKICKNAFANSSIEQLSIPSSILYLEDGWCSALKNLNHVKIMICDVKNIMLWDKNFVISKSDQKSGIFDVLLFARRNIKVAKIPPFINKIAPFAFQNCACLLKVDLPSEAKYVSIGQYAFANSSIRKIFLPSNVTAIGESAFYCCRKLEKVEFADKSKFNIISKCAFSESSIRKILIPSYVKKIGESSFCNCDNLKRIEFDNCSALMSIEKNAFSYSSIMSISMPSTVKTIGENAFYYCNNLHIVEIAKNLNMQSKDAFDLSSISGIMAPINLIESMKISI